MRQEGRGKEGRIAYRDSQPCSSAVADRHLGDSSGCSAGTRSKRLRARAPDGEAGSEEYVSGRREEGSGSGAGLSIGCWRSIGVYQNQSLSGASS